MPMKTISVPIALNQMSETGRGMATLLHDLGADSLISNIPNVEARPGESNASETPCGGF